MEAHKKERYICPPTNPHPSKSSYNKSRKPSSRSTIKEALEQKPDRDDVENWTSDVLFKLEEVHEDVRESAE